MLAAYFPFGVTPQLETFLATVPHTTLVTPPVAANLAVAVAWLPPAKFGAETFKTGAAVYKPPDVTPTLAKPPTTLEQAEQVKEVPPFDRVSMVCGNSVGKGYPEPELASATLLIGAGDNTAVNAAPVPPPPLTVTVGVDVYPLPEPFTSITAEATEVGLSVAVAVASVPLAGATPPPINTLGVVV